MWRWLNRRIYLKSILPQLSLDKDLIPFLNPVLGAFTPPPSSPPHSTLFPLFLLAFPLPLLNNLSLASPHLTHNPFHLPCPYRFGVYSATLSFSPSPVLSLFQSTVLLTIPCPLSYSPSLSCPPYHTPVLLTIFCPSHHSLSYSPSTVLLSFHCPTHHPLSYSASTVLLTIHCPTHHPLFHSPSTVLLTIPCSTYHPLSYSSSLSCPLFHTPGLLSFHCPTHHHLSCSLHHSQACSPTHPLSYSPILVLPQLPINILRSKCPKVELEINYLKRQIYKIYL